MATAIDVLSVARSQIGFIEGNNNENPYGLWYGIPDAPYCAMGISWCFAQVGASNLIAAQTLKGFSFTPAALHWFQMQGMVVNKMQGQPGDLIFYDWNGDGVTDHVELLEAASPGGITVIGFNTGNPNDTTKEGCWRIHRNYMFIIAVVRPRYPQLLKPTVGVSTSKKTTAVVATAGTVLTGGAIATHPGVTSTTPIPKPSPVVFLAEPFPTNPKSFIIGAVGNQIFTIQKGLEKLGLIPKTSVTGVMDKVDITALTKFENKNPILGETAGRVNQIVYDVLKAKI